MCASMSSLQQQTVDYLASEAAVDPQHVAKPLPGFASNIPRDRAPHLPPCTRLRNPQQFVDSSASKMRDILGGVQHLSTHVFVIFVISDFRDVALVLQKSCFNFCSRHERPYRFDRACTAANRSATSLRI